MSNIISLIFVSKNPVPSPLCSMMYAFEEILLSSAHIISVDSLVLHRRPGDPLYC